MLFHGAGAVGRIAVRGQEIPAYVAPPSSSQSFLTSLPSGWTLTRASANATNCTYLDGSTVTTYTTYAANTPRFTAFGLLIEPGRTNMFLNSDAPVNQAVTLALGTYTMWVLAPNANPTTIFSNVGVISPASASATNGTPVTFQVTTAGSLNVIVGVGVTRVQIEAGTSPTSYIPTAGVAVSRSVELLSCSGASLNLAEGTYLAEFMLNGTPNNNGRIFMAGSNPLGSALDADQMWMDVVAPRLISTVMDNAGNMPGYSEVLYTAPVFSVTRAAMAVSASHACSALNGVLGTAYGPTGLRPTAMTTLALMSGGGPPPINGILRSFKYWPVALNDAQLSAISAAGYFRDPPVFDLNFLSSVMPRRLSLLRSAGNAGVTITDGTINDASGAAYNTYGIATVAPTPRFNSQGLWVEPAHSNYYSNSNVPVTKTTAGMPSASSLILWVNGSGSAKVSNGTGTVILDGPNDTATQGNPVRFSITPNNTTATITITGTLGRVQVEQVGPVTPGAVLSPTSFMQTVAVGLRGNEYLQMSPANWYNAEQHTYFIECIMLGYTNNPVPISVYYSGGEREQIFLQMVDGFTVPRYVAWGEKHQNNINYGGVGLQQTDVPINVVHRFAYSVNMSKRKLAMDGLVGPETTYTYSSGPSLYPTAFLINAQNPSAVGAGMMRVRRVQMYDYAMTDAEIASLTAGAGEALDLDFMQPGTMPAGMTFTRASVATYFDSAGVMQTAASGAPRWSYDRTTLALRGLHIEEARTNSLKNSTMVGAVAGTPGTDPTGWSAATAPLGLTKTIVGVGVENGISYIDYRFAGTATTGSLNINLMPNGVNGIPCLTNQVWTGSFYISLRAGSLTNVTGEANLRLTQYNAGGSVSGGALAGLVIPPVGYVVGEPLTKRRISYTHTILDANCVFVTPYIQHSITAGPVDFTIRIGAPQVELGAFQTSFIPTSTVAVTRIKELLTGTVGAWNANNLGTLFVEGMQTGQWSVPTTYFGLGLAAAKTGIVMQGSNYIAMFDGTSAMNAQLGTIVPSVPFKAAMTYGPGTQAGCLNGGAIGRDTKTAIGQANTIVMVGNNTNVQQVNGYIRRAKIWTRTMPDDELIALTR